MAEETSPKVTGVPRWAWAVLIALSLILLSGFIAASYFSKSGKGSITAPQATTSYSQGEQTSPPKTEESGNVRGEKFMIFALLGAILLATALIPKLPAAKFLGGVGALLLIFGLITAAILWVWPQPLPPAAAFHSPATTSKGSQLPANAQFVKTLIPGEIIVFKRASMTAPPPERWVKNSKGKAFKIADWPADKESFYTENTWPTNADLYVALPPGQNYTTSAGAKTMAKAPPTTTTAAPPTTQETKTAAPAAPATSATPNGKYSWNGQEGYPGDR